MSFPESMNELKVSIVTTLICIMALPFSQATNAESDEVPAVSFSTTANDTITETPLSSSTVHSEDTKPPSNLTIRIVVPHNAKSVDHFAAYPYPVKPPRITLPVQMLPTKDAELKAQLLQSGYLTRSSGKRLYPPLGWRWEYAFNAALRHCGEGFPHSMLSMYQWCNKMLPYIKPECQRLNDGETARMIRYRHAIEYYDKNGSEAQNEATRNGLSALNIPIKYHGQGSVSLPTGTWWIAGTHKVPGLVYYWQQPVTIGDDGVQELQLLEANALLIQGAW